MKLLVNICARATYAVYGAAALGLYLALMFGSVGGFFGLVFSAPLFKGFLIAGLDIGLVLGAVIGVVGKEATLSVAKETWSGLPHAFYSMVVVAAIFGFPMLASGWLIGVLFNPELGQAFGYGAAAAGGTLGGFIGFCTGYSQRERALDAICDSLKTALPLILILAGVVIFIALFAKFFAIAVGTAFFHNHLSVW